ncbi:response regulator transcription factor [Pontibacter sp. G13]|uniref:response regulator transcription factor n=1 Tax=Pontibacter sp. G13 TaxID=3074898 RepID=UPI002889BC0F|nr:response regulator transcription factor [Pontibacter sp. G13]WNJ18979.1 response regulator transcription factor [Pontibacter sp. G13]
MEKTRLIIADDHPLYLDGLRGVVSTLTDIEIVSEAVNGGDLIEKVRQQMPDIVLTDIRMPVLDGLEATKELIKEFPDLKILALTMDADEQKILRMIQAGAMGYILKGTSRSELKQAISSVMDGNHYIHPDIANRVFGAIAKRSNRPSQTVSRQAYIEQEAQLTEREKEILKLIVVEELTNEKIAKRLFISKRTVDTHRKNLLLKTGSHNTVGLVKFSIRAGILQM